MALALSVEGSTGVPRPRRLYAFLSACIGTCSPLEREVHVELLLSACGGFSPPSWSACMCLAMRCVCRLRRGIAVHLWLQDFLPCNSRKQFGYQGGYIQPKRSSGRLPRSVHAQPGSRLPGLRIRGLPLLRLYTALPDDGISYSITTDYISYKRKEDTASASAAAFCYLLRDVTPHPANRVSPRTHACEDQAQHDGRLRHRECKRGGAVAPSSHRVARARAPSLRRRHLQQQGPERARARRTPPHGESEPVLPLLSPGTPSLDAPLLCEDSSAGDRCAAAV
eukprot:scaffold70210_cov63-Phaeocystis_antarctica.AAC.1